MKSIVAFIALIAFFAFLALKSQSVCCDGKKEKEIGKKERRGNPMWLPDFYDVIPNECEES